MEIPTEINSPAIGGKSNDHSLLPLATGGEEKPTGKEHKMVTRSKTATDETPDFQSLSVADRQRHNTTH